MTAASRKRRQYGTGSVSQRKDGLWVGRVEAGFSPSGARYRVPVYAKTELECRRKLEAKRKEIEANNGAPPLSPRLTIKAWADRWLPEHAREVRPRTYANDASCIKRWIIPTIGHRRIADLTAADVRAVRDAIAEAGLSTTTAHRTHRVLLKMLKDAVVEGIAVPRSALAVKAPRTATTDRDAMSAEDLMRVLDEASKRDNGVRWLIAALYGPRQGEALGLTTEAILLDKGIIDVSWQLQALPYIDARDKAKGFRVPDDYESRHLHRAYHLVRPKTSAGVRIWPIVPVLAEPLAHHLATRRDNPWGLLFTAVDDRYGKATPTPIRAADDRKEWHDLQAAVNVSHPSGRRYHLHETRHATVTILLDLGVDAEVVKAIVGHSSVIATMIYRHVQTKAMSEAVQALADRLKREVRALPSST